LTPSKTDAKTLSDKKPKEISVESALRTKPFNSKISAYSGALAATTDERLIPGMFSKPKGCLTPSPLIAARSIARFAALLKLFMINASTSTEDCNINWLEIITPAAARLGFKVGPLNSLAFNVTASFSSNQSNSKLLLIGNVKLPVKPVTKLAPKSSKNNLGTKSLTILISVGTNAPPKSPASPVTDCVVSRIIYDGIENERSEDLKSKFKLAASRNAISFTSFSTPSNLPADASRTAFVNEKRFCIFS